jgi:uncharacterized protein YbaR (Trm112 family)
VALAQVPSDPAGRPWLPLLLALGLLLAGALAMAGMLWLRARQGVPHAPPLPQARARSPRRVVSAQARVEVRPTTAPVSVDTSGVASASGAVEAQPATVYDPSPLDLAEVVVEVAPSDCLDTSVNGMSCPSCQRLFDMGALYCPYDSTPLQMVEVDASVYEVEDIELQCPDCGERYTNVGGFCPEDGARLLPADPEVQHYPAVPVMFCTHTHNEVPPGLTRPEGSPMLLPLTGRRTCGLPIAGPGRKRRICPECGVRYPLEASWCALDQAPLVNIN